jgi:hypothetical protein
MTSTTTTASASTPTADIVGFVAAAGAVANALANYSPGSGNYDSHSAHRGRDFAVISGG